jgi:predicted TIM-barrel fold metal-dependent hydrolase
MHIVSPDLQTYPLSPSAKYTPHPHTLSDYTTFLSTIPLTLSPNPTTTTTTPSFSNVTAGAVFVQPSPYGTDNTLVLSALSTLGPSVSRGIVVLPSPNSPTFPPPSELEQWHALGVRGVRVNLVSVGRNIGKEELRAELVGLAEKIRDVGVAGGGKGQGKWVLQLYVPLRMCEALEEIVPELGCRVVVDHLGSPDLPGLGVAGEVALERLQGWEALVRMVEAGSTWVKVSGWYRVSRAEGAVSDGLVRDEWLDGVGKRLIAARGGTRVVWASDWPHTRFEDKELDVKGFVERCWRWCDEVAEEIGGKGEDYAKRLFVGNAKELWDA